MEGCEADFIVRCGDEANSMNFHYSLDNVGGLLNGLKSPSLLLFGVAAEPAELET